MNTNSNTLITYQVDNVAYKELNKVNNENENECIICFQVLDDTTKKLIHFSCGHTYHFSCFNSWCKKSKHVLYHCISCNTVRDYTIIPIKMKKKKKKEAICFPCMIQ